MPLNLESVPHWTSGAFSFLGPTSRNFAPAGIRGSWRLAFRDSLRGPRNDVRGRHIFSGSWPRRRGGEQFLGPGGPAAPLQERHERFSPEKFGEEAGAEAAAQGQHGGYPRKGARAAARRQAGPARVEGPELPSGTARSARLLSLSRQDAALGLGGARNTPLSPPPRLPGRCTRAVRPVASPGRAPGAERLPGARILRVARQGAGAQSLREKRRPHSRFRAEGLACGRPGALDQPEPPLAS